MAESKWAKVLDSVASPLKFFALALLVVDGGIAVVATIALEGDQIFYAVLIMAFLFFLVVVIVGFITFVRPMNLQQVDEMKHVIESEGFKDAVEDIVVQELKKRDST